MTLVLLYANSEFVTVAADRRTTKGKKINDHFTKSAVIFNQFLFSFTGLAELGPDRQTIEWLFKTAAKYRDHGFAAADIAEEATRALANVTAPREKKRLAFAGIGFDDKKQITCVLISNMHELN